MIHIHQEESAVKTMPAEVLGDENKRQNLSVKGKERIGKKEWKW